MVPPNAKFYFPKNFWLFFCIVGGGIFTGTFWLLIGFLRLLGTSAAWWQYVLTLAPGSAILFLVSGARRHPLPYGTALLILGIFPLLMLHLEQALALRFLFGLPLIFIGLAFIFWRNKLQAAFLHKPE